jgi:hypothetical protein
LICNRWTIYENTQRSILGGGGGMKEDAVGGGGESRAPTKAGPPRPPLLNGIKFGCIVTIGIYYGLEQWLILSQGVGKGFLLEQVQDSRYTTNMVHTGS